ncbi:dynein light chain LC8-type, partial [Schistosoma bovis]
MASEHKAVVKNADMSDDMQQEAVDCAAQALEKYSVEKDIAAFIKKEFDRKYNPTWHCIVGRNFGSMRFVCEVMRMDTQLNSKLNKRIMASEHKAVVKNADMSDDMQQEAVDCAAQALEKYSVEKDIAAFIKKEFDRKYNPTWHCIVGRNFG